MTTTYTLQTIEFKGQNLNHTLFTLSLAMN
jgi:hypothetical protein